MVHRRSYRSALAAVAIAVFMAQSPADSDADTFRVTRTGDPEPNGCKPRDCSLREAVLKANAKSGGDEIVLKSGATYELTSPTLGDLDITAPVAVHASGKRWARVRGDRTDGVVEVHDYESSRRSRFAGLRISGGNADAGAGGITSSEDTSVVDCAIKRNSGGPAGAIYARDGHLIVRRSAISGNRGEVAGGISAVRLEMTDSVMRGNRSTGAAAASAGAGVLGDRPENSRTSRTFIIERTRIIGNSSAGGTGGFVSGTGFISLGWSKLARNHGATHGAVDAGDDATLWRSVVTRNTGESGAGGIAGAAGVAGRAGHFGVFMSTLSHNSGYTGGAADISGKVRFEDSTISWNTSQTVGGGITAESGDVVNSTVAHNSAAGDGGGVYAHGSGRVNVIYATVARNRADADGTGDGAGGGVATADPEIPTRIANTLLAFNTVGSGGTDEQCAGSFDAIGGNLRTSSDPGCVGFDGRREQIAPRPRIGRLGDHGGPTETIPLRRRSPAVDTTLGYFAPRHVDQRGFPRGFPNGNYDIGAYEYQRR